MTALLAHRLPRISVTARQRGLLLVAVVLLSEGIYRVAPVATLGIHAMIIIAAMVRTAQRTSTRTATPLAPFDQLLAAISVVSIARFAALASTSSDWPLLVSVGLTGAISLTAVHAVATQIDLTLRPLLRFPTPSVTLLLGPAGIVLGEVLYLALDLEGADPRLLDRDSTGILLTMATLVVLLVFIGLADELMYRGLLQTSMVNLFGVAGIPMVAALYGVGIAGWVSVRWGIALGCVSLLFGWVRHKTGSIVPSAILHGFMAYALVEVWPNAF